MGRQADKAFVARIARWKAAFTDDTTGIRTLTEDMLWDYAAFRTAIRVVKLAAHRQRELAKDDDRQLINQMLFDLLAKGYWSSLLLGARKLLDRGSLVGRFGVYSLRSILGDVEACRPKLTRRFYVEHLRHCRYDLEVLRQENRDALEAAGGVMWGDPALTFSELAHRDFDQLSGVAEADRQEADLIDPAVLVLLEARLAELDRIGDHVSTHLAHAGNSESRQGKGLDEFDIREAHRVLRALKEVGDLVGRWFAGGEISTLAVYQGDQFEGLDMALVTPTEMAELAENWDAIERDIASWELSYEGLFGELDAKDTEQAAR